MDPGDMKVDSKEGIEYLLRWAKAHGVVLNQAHADVAEKHGVPIDGVIIAGRIPLSHEPLPR